MIRPPFSASITDASYMLERSWVTWITQLWSKQSPLIGTTAQRPTTNLELGMTYFDSTLGKPVWLKSTGPSVWVDGVGVPS